MADYADTFDTLDSAHWPDTLDASIDTGRLKLPVSATDSYIISPFGEYDMTPAGSYMIAEVDLSEATDGYFTWAVWSWDTSPGDDYTEIDIDIRSDPNNEILVRMYDNAGGDIGTIGPVAYDPDAMRWLRIRFDGTAFVETSTDSSAWTTLLESTGSLAPIRTMSTWFRAGDFGTPSGDMYVNGFAYNTTLTETPEEPEEEVTEGYGSGEYGSGPYGGVTAPTTVPPVRVAERTAAWRWMVGPHGDARPSWELSSATDRTVNLHLHSPDEASFVISGSAHESGQIEELITDLTVMRNNETMFRGRINKVLDTFGDDGNQKRRCSAIDYRGMLNRRILWEDLTHDPAATPPTVAEEHGTIIRELIDSVQERINGYIGITFDPAWPDTGVDRVVQFRAGDEVWASIQILNGMEGAPDFWIDPATRIAYLGTKGEDTGEVLDYGGVISSAERLFSSEDYANALYLTGTEGLSTVKALSDGDMSAAPEGRWEARVSDSDLTTAEAVEATADKLFVEKSRLVPSYSLTFARNKWHGLSHIGIGDIARVVVKVNTIRDILSSRVFDMSITLDDSDFETVTVTTETAKVDLQSLLRGIMVRVDKSLKR